MKGKNIVITGSGRGIGKAIALACTKEGANVGLISRTLEELEALKNEIENLHPQAQVAVKTADVVKIDEMTETFNYFKDVLGILDGVIANAGWSRMGNSHEFDSGQFSAIININILGVFNTFKAAYPHLKKENKKEKGRFLITGSAIYPNLMPKFAAYGASKFGVVGLQKELALEYKGENITFNMVLPTMVDTRLLRGRKAGDGNKPDYVMDPSELGGYYVFLLSDEANRINNQLIQTSDIQKVIAILKQQQLEINNGWEAMKSYLQEKAPNEYNKIKGYGKLIEYLINEN
ncbi:MAG: SDR family NAD(P)-dependent oxidoreductase [Promethearchaeota archaeon]